MKKFILSLAIVLSGLSMANAACPPLTVVASDVCSGYSFCGFCQSTNIEIQGTLPANVTINWVKLIVAGSNVPAGQLNAPLGDPGTTPAFFGQFPYYTYRNSSIAGGSGYVLQIQYTLAGVGSFNCNYPFSIALNTTPASPIFNVHAKTVSQVMAGQSFINTVFYANDPITFDASLTTNTMEYYIECTEVNSSGVAIGGANLVGAYYPSIPDYYFNLRTLFSNLVNPTGMVMNKYYKIRMSALGCSSSNPILYDKIIRVNAAARPLIIKQPLAIPPISGLVISPNPSNGTFTFTADELPDQLSVIVYNIDGKEVYNVSSTEENRVEVAIDLGTQNPGMYFIQINTATEQLVEKIIIE